MFFSPPDFLGCVSILRILNVCFTDNEGDTRALIMALDSVLQRYKQLKHMPGYDVTYVMEGKSCM